MSAKFNARLASIPGYTPGVPKGQTAEDVAASDLAQLASNESPHPPLPEVLAAIVEAANSMNRYPDPDATRLRSRLAELHGVGPERIAVSNGSCEILLAASEAMLEPGAGVVYAWPAFSMYPNLAAINAPTTVGIAAAAQVLSQSPRKGEVQVTGLGTPNQMREFIKDGTVQKFALWDPALQGVIAANLIAGIKSGAITPGEEVTFEVPGVGERIMAGADRIIIAGPPQEFDASNIDDFDF